VTVTEEVSSIKRTWYRRRWVHFAVVGVVGLAIGAVAGNSAAADAEKRAVKAERAAEVADEQRVKAETDMQTAVAANEKIAADLATADERALADAKTSLAAREAGLKQKEAAVAARERAVGTAEAVAKANTIPGDGVFLIPSDVRPGTYKSGPPPSGNCYYARLTGPGGDIIDNGNTSGPVVITIRSSDGALELSGCAEFRKVG
jgi:nucleoid-associated protein YgaU